jgi:hypothetical protein
VVKTASQTSLTISDMRDSKCESRANERKVSLLPRIRKDLECTQKIEKPIPSQVSPNFHHNQDLCYQSSSSIFATTSLNLLTKSSSSSSPHWSPYSHSHTPLARQTGELGYRLDALCANVRRCRLMMAVGNLAIIMRLTNEWGLHV